MKKRRRTTNSRSFLPDDENLDIIPSISTVEPSATTASVEPLTTTVSVESETTLTAKSNVWEYFERCLVVGPLKAKCLLCQEELLTPNYATSSLKRHLVQRHGLKQFGSNQTASSSLSSSINVNISKTEKQKLDSLAVDAIIKDSRAFGDLQKSGLKKLIDALRPGEFFLLCVIEEKNQVRVEQSTKYLNCLFNKDQMQKVLMSLLKLD